MSSDTPADAEGIISTFRILPTNEARSSAYHGVITELTAAEWRDVKLRVNERSFQCDIFGSLPIELAAEVCSYLDPADVVSSQRVSKRWKDMMSHPHVCRASYSHHYPADPPLDPSNPEWRAFFIKKAKRGRAIGTGRPYSKAVYPTQGLLVPTYLSSDDKIHYCDGRLAWISDDAAVAVLSLENGQQFLLFPENRVIINEIRISESIVAAILQNGYCHVWDLHNRKSYSFRLPSITIRHFVVAGDKVAISLPLRSLIVWDRESQISHEIELKCPMAICFNYGRNRLFVVQAEPLSDETSPPDGPDYQDIIISEYSINKTGILRSERSLPAVWDHYFCDEYLCQQKPNATAMIYQWFYRDVDIPPFPDRQVFFDFSLGVAKASVQIHTFGPSSLYGGWYDPYGRFIPMPGDVIYFTDGHRPSSENKGISIYNSKPPSSRRLLEISDVEKEHPTEEEILPDELQYIYGDDKFVCLVRLHDPESSDIDDSDAVHVYCFDENVSMAGEVPYYRRTRNRKARERAEERKHKLRKSLVGTTTTD